MPTLVRLLTMALLIAGAVFATMLALVHLVEPRQHRIVVDVPLDRLKAPAPTPVGQPIRPARP